MHSHCRAHSVGLQMQRLPWLLLIYRARIYQQASISAILGVLVPSYLLCETSKASLSAWELLIFDSLCAPRALSLQMTNLSKMPLSITWDVPAFSSIFGTPLKLEKGKGEKEQPSYNSPFPKYSSHTNVSVPPYPLCKLLIINRISISLASEAFWASRIFSLWRKKERAFHSCSGTTGTGGFVQHSYG